MRWSGLQDSYWCCSLREVTGIQGGEKAVVKGTCLG